MCNVASALYFGVCAGLDEVAGAQERIRIIWITRLRCSVHWQGVKASEDAALQAAAAAQAAESGSNAVETTSKAALSALRCSQVTI